MATSTETAAAPRVEPTSCRCTASTTSSCGSATPRRRATTSSTRSVSPRWHISGLETGPRIGSRECSSRARSCWCSTGTLHSDTEIARAPRQARRRRQGDRAVGPRRRPRLPRGDHSRRDRPRASPTTISDSHGRVRIADVATYGETVHRFVDRSAYEGPFLPGFAAVGQNGSGRQELVGGIDHVVGNVELGAMQRVGLLLREGLRDDAR